MKYVILFEDDDDFAHMRPQFMAEHLQFLADNSDRIEIAGPMKDAVSAEPAGGLWLVDADSAAQAQALIESDPSGLPVCARPFESWSGRRFMPMARR
jgi:uncharacterized protein YciI